MFFSCSPRFVLYVICCKHVFTTRTPKVFACLCVRTTFLRPANSVIRGHSTFYARVWSLFFVCPGIFLLQLDPAVWKNKQMLQAARIGCANACHAPACAYPSCARALHLLARAVAVPACVICLLLLLLAPSCLVPISSSRLSPPPHFSPFFLSLQSPSHHPLSP